MANARRSVGELAALPTAQALLTRLTVARLKSSGIDPNPLLTKATVAVSVLDNPEARVAVQTQSVFMDLAAEALGDDCLGLNLARDFDCRNLGLLYYVLASSDTVGAALERGSRYSRISNEAIVFEFRKGEQPSQRVAFNGMPRHLDRHQIEFCMVAVVKLCRLLTGRQFVPGRVSMVHLRTRNESEFARFFGTEVVFGSEFDEIVFAPEAITYPLVDADPRLSKILLQVCEDSLASRKTSSSPLRVSVENALTPLLPHGTARVDVVARQLGMSERTLARRLSEEGVTFIEIVRQLKVSLARHYLEEEKIPISKIAWLLGFEDASSFSHACKRWTGKSPRELRSSESAAA